MITKVKIGSGILTKINAIPTKLHFTDGVNIIYAPNGAGKTVLLKSIAHYFPVTPPTPMNYPGVSQKSMTFENYLRTALNPLSIDYDGGAVYYFGADNHQNLYGNFYSAMDGNGDLLNSIRDIVTKPSTGQLAIKFINNIANLEPTVNLDVINPKVNDMWQKTQAEFVRYYKQFPSTGKPTVMLDEIETHIDPLRQLQFLSNVLQNLSDKFQVICVTHNPLALFLKDCNIINCYTKAETDEFVNSIKSLIV